METSREMTLIRKANCKRDFGESMLGRSNEFLCALDSRSFHISHWSETRTPLKHTTKMKPAYACDRGQLPQPYRLL